jgi:hypothetical protein
MGAGHLHRDRAFNFIPRCDPFNQRQRGIHPDFRNPAEWQLSSYLQFQQGGVDEIA